MDQRQSVTLREVITTSDKAQQPDFAARSRARSIDAPEFNFRSPRACCLFALSAAGKWFKVFKMLVAEPDMEWVFIDGSYAKAHQHSAGAASANDEAIGKSRAGNTSKIHLAVDAHGLPIEFEITGGQINDCTQAPALISKLPWQGLIATFCRLAVFSGGGQVECLSALRTFPASELAGRSPRYGVHSAAQAVGAGASRVLRATPVRRLAQEPRRRVTSPSCPDMSCRLRLAFCVR